MTFVFTLKMTYFYRVCRNSTCFSLWHNNLIGHVFIESAEVLLVCIGSRVWQATYFSIFTICKPSENGEKHLKLNTMIYHHVLRVADFQSYNFVILIKIGYMSVVVPQNKSDICILMQYSTHAFSTKKLIYFLSGIFLAVLWKNRRHYWAGKDWRSNCQESWRF